MSNGKDPFGFNKMTRIQTIAASQTSAGDLFISKIQQAKQRLEDIESHLDEHLGFDPEGIDFDKVGIIQGILNELDDALTACEKTSDLNQAIDQSDRDHPAR